MSEVCHAKDEVLFICGEDVTRAVDTESQKAHELNNKTLSKDTERL